MMCKNLRLYTIRRLICDDPGTLMKIHGRHTRRPQTKPGKAAEREAKSSGLVRVDKQDTGLDLASRCTEKTTSYSNQTKSATRQRRQTDDPAFIFVSEKSMKKKLPSFIFVVSQERGKTGFKMLSTFFLGEKANPSAMQRYRHTSVAHLESRLNYIILKYV